VAPGSYALEVSRNGFVTDAGPGMLNVSVKAGGAIEDLRLKLIPAGAISGTVVDRDGEPVQGLSVRIQGVRYLPGAKRQIFEGMRATTDDRGRFRLYGLNRGLYYLRTGGRIETSREMLPLKQGPDRGLQYGDTWYPENALTEFGEPLRIDSGSEIGDVRVVVKREQVWTITGHVLGGSTELECRKALPVTLMYGSSEEIGPDGAFKIEGVEAGDYVLSARTVRDGKMIFQGYAPVRVIDRNVRTTIPLGGTGEVRGKVTAEGLQPGGMEVYLESDDELAIYPSKVDPAGLFAIRDVPPGAYRFTLRSNRYYIQTASCPEPLVVSAGSVLGDCTLKLADDTGEVRGRGAPPNAEVVAVPWDVELRRVARSAAHARVDQEGRFVLRNVVPGEYWLFARTGIWMDEVYALHFPERHAAEGIRLEVQSREVVTLEDAVLR
jgi:hypothetical protein